MIQRNKRAKHSSEEYIMIEGKFHKYEDRHAKSNNMGNMIM